MISNRVRETGGRKVGTRGGGGADRMEHRGRRGEGREKVS